MAVAFMSLPAELMLLAVFLGSLSHDGDNGV
jgi:hypothetical protein